MLWFNIQLLVISYNTLIIIIVHAILVFMNFRYTYIAFKYLCANWKQVFFTLAIRNQVCFMGPDDLAEKNVLPTVSIGSNFKYIINNNKTQRMPHRVFHDFLLISRFILLRCRYYIIPRVRSTPKFFILFNFFLHKYFRLFIHLVWKMCALLSSR